MTVGRQLLSQLDPEAVLAQVLEHSRVIAGARYAALGVLNEERTQIDRFLTAGIDEDARRRIGELPRGRGLLGVLIADPKPLRLREVGSHLHSFGFPAMHPPMRSFLGVPIVIRGSAWGNLYLTEKEGADEFTQADEEAVLLLAQFAATAIENARLYQLAEQGRQALQRANDGLEAARDIASAIGAEPDVDRILELIVKRGRALIDAQTVLILLKEGPDLVVAAAAGVAGHSIGRRTPIAGTISGRVLATGTPERADDVAAQLPVAYRTLGIEGSSTALFMPMTHRGSGVGLLIALDRGQAGEAFTAFDEQLLRAFAASASNAVAISRSVEADRLRSTMAAAEEERRRWARDLHDQTLQALGGLRVGLGSASRKEDPAELLIAIRQANQEIDLEIASLRAIISDVRPSLLDDLGLQAALESLIDKRRDDGLAVTQKLVNLSSGAGGRGVLTPALETTVYRLVQEALTNVVKHADATAVTVHVEVANALVEIDVIDDGVGFDTAAITDGFGLTGIRERAYLAGGVVEMSSGEGATALKVRIPTSVGVSAWGMKR